MNRLGTFLHIHANLPNIIISQSVFLKEGTSIGRRCLTCKIGIIAVRKNKITTKPRPCVSEYETSYLKSSYVLLPFIFLLDYFFCLFCVVEEI